MYAAIVLAGGRASRMGGTLKPLLRIKGRTILSRVVAAVSDADRIVVVGPPELRPELPDAVDLTREQPPGGGPVAGLAAGMARCTDADEVAVVAADLPFLTTTALAALRHHSGAAVLYVDDEGRWQSMVSLWRASALSRALESVPVKMKDLLKEAGEVRAIRWTGQQPPPWFDCDTPQDLELAERLL